MYQRGSTLALCDDPEHWGRVGGGGEVEEGGDCVHLCGCMEPTQHCNAIILQLKKKQNQPHKRKSLKFQREK